MDRRAEYTVRGMTCAHCVASVREEVGEVPGVRGVDVDLESGRLTVTGDDVEDAAVRAAVAEAGYEVTPWAHPWSGWAFGYDVAALPLAAAGVLNPLLAGLAMAFSSVSVVLNALRLRRYSPCA